MTAAFNQMLAQGPTPIKFENPVNQMAQLMQLKNAQQTGVVNQMAIDKGNRQLADQAAYRNMLAQPGFNSTDPATRAQMLGLGRGEDLTALDASAKTQRDLAKTAYDERAASYKAGAPFNGSVQDYLDYFDAGAQDPVLGAHWESNEGGIAPMRARLVQVLSTPEGLAHVREAAGGESQATRDTHDVAMGRIAKDNALAAKAGRPDAAVKPLAINKMTIRDPNNPDRSIIVNANVPPNDPNYVLGEAPQSASALAAQTKKENAAETRQAGKQTVDNIIASLEQNVADLEAAGGLADTGKSAAENIGPYLRSTKIGQGFGAMTGSKVQSILDIMKSNRLQLLNAMKTASGMSSKVVDSNQELKTWLESFGKEGGSKQAVLQILKNLKSYGEGDTGGSTPPDGTKPAAKTEATTFEEGHIIVNPKTGKRAVLQGGAWVPIP